MCNERVRVLLVEDDEDDYILTRDLLSEAQGDKYDLEWVQNYDAALEAIGRNQHDIYLIDYRLGAHDGLELLRHSVQNGCERPMILLTGQGNQSVEAMQAGAADHLVKGRLDSSLLERSIRYFDRAQEGRESARSPLLLKLFDDVLGREVEVDLGCLERVMA